MTDATPSVRLPQLSADAEPDFVDVSTCGEWLANVPLANVAAAQQQLLAQVGEFNRFPTKPANRFAVLEALREAVNFVQIEQAKRFVNRALPLAEAENRVLLATTTLWDQMQIGYLHCMDAALAGDAEMRAQAAVVCQRVLAYAGLKMFHYCRAYRELPTDGWGSLHRAYVAAEKLDVVNEPVKDYLNRDVQDASTRVAYLRAALMGLASPNELSQRQLTFVAYLLERWADKVDIAAEPGERTEEPVLVVDLAGNGPPERVTDPADVQAREPRYLDTRRLAKSLRNRIGLLRKGESPARLALGEDCVQPSCEQLLVFLYRQWCQVRSRVSERRPLSSVAQACNDMAAIYYYISGRVFKQPADPTKLTQKQREEIATFGRVSTREEDDGSSSIPKEFVLEDWQVLDESSQGMRFLRKAQTQGKRYVHGQLVGVRPGDSKSFMLGQVRWLSQTANGDLHAGLRILPGLPAAVAVRGTGLNAANDKWVPALSVTAVAALGTPPALILPAGWFKPKRVIEVWIDATLQVRLLEILERGTDFERLAYETLS
jgi:hypothetical protein